MQTIVHAQQYSILWLQSRLQDAMGKSAGLVAELSKSQVLAAVNIYIGCLVRPLAVTHQQVSCCVVLPGYV